MTGRASRPSSAFGHAFKKPFPAGLVRRRPPGRFGGGLGLFDGRESLQVDARRKDVNVAARSEGEFRERRAVGEDQVARLDERRLTPTQPSGVRGQQREVIDAVIDGDAVRRP